MSSIGRLFKVTTFGESHGLGVGCIIEGVPPLLKIISEDIQYQLNRRKPNQNSLLSPRNEPDIVQIYSGIQDGITLGTPVCLIIKNMDMKPGDYKKFSNIPRPGHADLTYNSKYGLNSSSGGGRASARETVARVAAGALAEKYLNSAFTTEIVAWVKSVGPYEIPKEVEKELVYDSKLTKFEVDRLGSYSIYMNTLVTNNVLLLNDYTNKLFCLFLNDELIEEVDINTLETVYDEKDGRIIMLFNPESSFEFKETINIRCPHPETAVKIIRHIIKIKEEGDSAGGIVSCVIRNCPQSLGEPCFDKFEADLAKAMLSIPATKGFEIGSGFEGTKMK